MFENPNLQLPVNDDAEYFARKIDYSHENEREVQLDLDMDRVLAERRELKKRLLPTYEFNKKIAYLEYYVEEKLKMTPEEQMEFFKEIFGEVIDLVSSRTELQFQLGTILDLTQLKDFNKFVSEHERVQMLSFLESPEYMPAIGKVRLPEWLLISNPRAILNDIATFGLVGLPSRLMGLFHEFIHSNQSDQKEVYAAALNRTKMKNAANIGVASATAALMAAFPDSWYVVAVGYLVITNGLMYMYKKNRILGDQVITEVPAYMAMSRMSFSHDKYIPPDFNDTLVTSCLIQQMNHKYYKMNRKKDIDRIISCAQSVNRLYLLGLSHEAIQALVKKAKWDKKRLAYDTLKDEEERLMKENGISPEELDTAVDVDRAKATNLNLQVKVVVHEYIDKLVHVEQV